MEKECQSSTKSTRDSRKIEDSNRISPDRKRICTNDFRNFSKMDKKNRNVTSEDINEEKLRRELEPEPHVLQVILNGAEAGYSSRLDIPFTRILLPDAPRLPYRRRKDEVKTVIHWGQRKLLMSEIEFLSNNAEGQEIVVYAGAAPGTHISLLSRMFRGLKFVLVDPAPFSIQKNDNVEIRQEMFTDEIAKEFARKESVLFISDIRSADWSQISEEECDQRIYQDMILQKRWHETIKPKASMLKFRLSWKPGLTNYLEGDIFLPVWGPITTTESRLVVHKNAGLCDYDNTSYEERMFFFNTVSRVARYDHSVEGEGIDHCYDCTAEIFILCKYLKTAFYSKFVLEEENSPFHDKPEHNEQCISKLSLYISRSIAQHRTLLSPNLDPGERKEAIKKRQYIQGKPAYERKDDENHADGPRPHKKPR